MENKNIAISVCVPFYNAEPFIAEAMESILGQSFQDFELILVNDGSSDRSLEIARSFQDNRVRIIDNSHDYIASLNIGLSEAKGRYIARADADDIMHPDRLLIQYNYLENHPEVTACGGGFQAFGILSQKCIPISLEPGEIEEESILGNCFTAGMFRKDFVKTHQIFYRRDYLYAEDYKLWIDIISSGGRLVNLPQVFIYYRIHDKQITRTCRERMSISTLRTRRDIILYLLSRESEKYKPIVPQAKALEQSFQAGEIPLEDYCSQMCTLLKSISS